MQVQPCPLLSQMLALLQEQQLFRNFSIECGTSTSA